MTRPLCAIILLFLSSPAWAADPGCDWTKLRVGMLRAELIELCGLPIDTTPRQNEGGFYEVMQYGNNHDVTVWVARRHVFEFSGPRIHLRGAGM